MSWLKNAWIENLFLVSVGVESMLLEFEVDSSLMFPSLLDALLFHPDPPVTILNGSNGAANGGYVNGSYVNGSGITKLESTATLISEASSKLWSIVRISKHIMYCLETRPTSE